MKALVLFVMSSILLETVAFIRSNSVPFTFSYFWETQCESVLKRQYRSSDEGYASHPLLLFT